MEIIPGKLKIFNDTSTKGKSLFALGLRCMDDHIIHENTFTREELLVAVEKIKEWVEEDK